MGPDMSVTASTFVRRQEEFGADDKEVLAYPFSYHGSGMSLLGIHIVNLLFTVCSLGVYYFWSKARIREYLYRNVEFMKDRFAFHGTGQEMFVGFLKALLILGIPYFAITYLPELLPASHLLRLLASLTAAAFVAVVIPRAVVSARRYHLSRSSWRGIRFSFRGPIGDYIYLFLIGWALTILSLGAYYPFFSVKRHEFLTSHSYFGDHQFHFQGNGSDLSPTFVAAYLLFPFTLGLSSFWYLAVKHRYFWENTTIASARFHSTVAATGLFRLKLANFLILVLSLGLASPWTQARSLDFYLSRLSLVGSPKLEQVAQDVRAGDATGEGMAQFLDAGLTLG